MKLNEIKSIANFSDNSERLSSVKNYLVGDPALHDIIKTIMINESVEGQHYSDFMKMKPELVSRTGTFNSIEEVTYLLATAKYAFVPHLAFCNKTKKFDVDSGDSVACVVKIDDRLCSIDAGRTKYHVRTFIDDTLRVFSHNLDEVDLRQTNSTGASQPLFNYGWVIFK